MTVSKRWVITIGIFLVWTAGVFFTYGSVLASNAAFRQQLGGSYAYMTEAQSKRQDWSDAVVSAAVFPVTIFVAIDSYLQCGWQWREP